MLAQANVLVMFSVAVVKPLDKSRLKEDIFLLPHGSGVYTLMAGKLSWRELEEGPHTTSTVSKQMGALHVLLLICLRTQAQHGLLGWLSPFSMNPST